MSKLAPKNQLASEGYPQIHILVTNHLIPYFTVVQLQKL